MPDDPNLKDPETDDEPPDTFNLKDPSQAPTGAPATGDEPLGEPGKRALEAERAARKAAEAQAKQIQTQLDELKQAQMTDQEKALDAARKEGEQASDAKNQRRLFASDARVAAAGKLQDPSLLADPDVAQRLLGLAEIPVDAAGDIDSEAISKAIDTLIETRPYLAATNGATPNPGSADGGARGTGTPPTIADQIAAAEKAGDWATAGRLKSQQLMELHSNTT